MLIIKNSIVGFQYMNNLNCVYVTYNELWQIFIVTIYCNEWPLVLGIGLVNDYYYYNQLITVIQK